MPPPETFERNQKAVLRPVTGQDYYGDPALGDPEELDVRWKWGSTQMRGPNGQPVAVDAQVVLGNIEVMLGSRMWECSLEEYMGTGSATNAEPIQMEVVAYKNTPDLKNRFVRRTVGLAFYRYTKDGEDG